MTIIKPAILAASLLVLAFASQTGRAAYEDGKAYSVGGCNPYTTGTPNYSLLRFRPESVQNQSNGYLYVICPIIRDTELSWGLVPNFFNAEVWVEFRTNTTGTFQCTLTLGSNAHSVWSDTKSVSGDPGQTLVIQWSTAETGASTATEQAPAALVCRIPPKGSIVSYQVWEYGMTQDTL